jgi:hypothetical protein
MWFNTWGWHVKNSETSISFNYWMVWLHFWRMPPDFAARFRPEKQTVGLNFLGLA